MYVCIYMYIYSIPTTCFGHTCGSPQECALRRIYYTFFEPMHKRKVLIYLIFLHIISKSFFNISYIMHLPEEGHKCGRNMQEVLLNIYMHLLVSSPEFQFL